MLDTLKPGEPLWWLARLEKVIADRRTALQRYDDYYSGKHPLQFASDRWREAFGELFASRLRDNWCELVVDAVKERLQVQGFRLGLPPAEGEQEDPDAAPLAGDDAAWEMWQRNQMDADHGVAITEALIHGTCPVSVWGDSDDNAIISVEDPKQVAVAYEGGSRRHRRAALKRFVDEWTGQEMATVYLPEGVFKYSGRTSMAMGGDGLWLPSSVTGYSGWAPREIVGEPWPLPNPLGAVTVVELQNNPRLKGGRSELDVVIPMQDAANKLLTDLLVASEFASFRQKWATGLEIPVDKTTGKPVEEFVTAVNRVWTSKKTDARFGDFSETDLRNIVSAIEMVVQHMASQTRTPPHYFYLRGEFPSGESIKSAETGLVAKGRARMVHFGEGFEEVVRLGFLAQNDARRAAATSMETVWADPESRSESEHVDAVMKKKALDVPVQQLWEELGYGPSKIKDFERMRARSALLGGAGLDMEALLEDPAESGVPAGEL